MGRMHAYPGRTFGQLYHRFFRTNDLANGRLALTDRTIDLADVTVPLLAIAGRGDGIAPVAGVPPPRPTSCRTPPVRARDGAGRPPRRAHRPRRARDDLEAARRRSSTHAALQPRRKADGVTRSGHAPVVLAGLGRAAARCRAGAADPGAGHPDRRHGGRARHRRPDAVAGRRHARRAFSARSAQPIEVRVARPSADARPGRRSASASIRRGPPARASTTPRSRPTAPVDVPLHVTYDGATLAAFTVSARPRLGHRAAQRAPADHAPAHEVVRRARMGWSIDERALAGALDPLLADPHAARGRPRGARAGAAERQRQRPAPRAPGDGHHRPRATSSCATSRTSSAARPTASRSAMPGYATPTGRFSIVNKAVNPAWTAPDEPWAGAYRNEVVEGGAAENPLKARWMGIVGGVGHPRHGGRGLDRHRASHGCIRMRVADVIDLYPARAGRQHGPHPLTLAARATPMLDGSVRPAGRLLSTFAATLRPARLLTERSAPG